MSKSLAEVRGVTVAVAETRVRCPGVGVAGAVVVVTCCACKACVGR